MNNRLKKAVKAVLPGLITAILIAAILVATKGMYLIDMPDISQVEKVTIFYPEVCGEAKEITDAEHVEQAVKLTGFLKYSIFDRYKGDDKPLITITYFLKNGNEISVSASRETVWWKGRGRVLSQEDMFVNLAEGIFFSDDLVGD